MEPITNKKETRNVPFEIAEVRADPESRLVEGLGIVFNSESRDLGGFIEKILPSAVDGVLEKSDVLALMNHDINRGVLARSSFGSGSMQLTKTPVGVKYRFNAPRFDLGNELLEGIKRNDIKSSSFAFSVSSDGQKWEKMPDGRFLRTITKFENIFDMSPCYREAYQDTTIAIRSLNEIQNDPGIPVLESDNPDPAKTGSDNLPVNDLSDDLKRDARQLSLEERYFRQLNYSFKIKKL